MLRPYSQDTGMGMILKRSYWDTQGPCSGRGCRKKGIEYLVIPQFAFSGVTTRRVVDFTLLLVRRCSLSPTLTTICSGNEVKGAQLPCISKSVPKPRHKIPFLFHVVRFETGKV
jgi:hypothetical protein